jgi:hypothetical protein
MADTRKSRWDNTGIVEAPVAQVWDACLRSVHS